MSIDKETESNPTVVEKTIGELQPRMSGINITVKVMSKMDAREVSSRFGGAIFKVADALVGDSSGCILMTLWNEEIDRVNANETILIKNGRTSLFRGSMRLNAGKYGTIEHSERTITEVNEQNNLSNRQFEQEPRYPKFQPFYRDTYRGRRSGRGGRNQFRRR